MSEEKSLFGINCDLKVASAHPVIFDIAFMNSGTNRITLGHAKKTILGIRLKGPVEEFLIKSHKFALYQNLQETSTM